MSRPAILTGTAACWLLLIAVSVPKRLTADEVAPNGANSVASDAKTSSTVPPSQADTLQSEAGTPPAGAGDSSRRDRIRTVGVLLLGLVVALGGCAIGFSVIWGGRLRRMIRRNPAEPTDYDPFWYLRKRPAAGDQTQDGPATEANVDPPAESTGEERS